MAKMRVAVLFGGASSEHEISCISAAAICDHMDPDKYEVLKVGITQKGRWVLYPGSTDGMRDGSWERNVDNVPAVLSPDTTSHGLILNHSGSFKIMKLDVVFPALHGKNGEDGTMQGLLDLCGIPYVGCGVLASAQCMDKSTTCLLFDKHGIPHTPWIAVHRREMENFEEILVRVREALQFPIFVKPASAGSSIGVTRVETENELRSAMLLASAHDAKIVLEQAVVGQEVECAVLGNADPAGTTPGEISSCNEKIYDYDAKYHSGDASKLYIPARLSPEKLEEVRAMAVKAYRCLGCEGLSRVDFFVEKDTGRVLINEINTLPGFTSISMYPKLWEHDGLSFSELVDRLIELALERAKG